MDVETEVTESQASEEEDEPRVRVGKHKRKKHVTTDNNPKKINMKRIVINVSDTQYPVVSEVADELEWKIQTKTDTTNWDVFWTDGAILPQVLFRMNFHQKINHYPGIHVLARKNLLGLNLMAMRQHYKQQYDFFPQTWLLPSQFSEFRHYYQAVKKGKVRTFIVKPEADCQGRGIFLTRSIEGTSQSNLELTNGHHYVVQRYLTKPFLIQGLKFDMRVYVLLAGTDPLRVYLYNEGLARFATEQYEQPNPENMDNMCMHLTNYAINKLNPKFIFNTSSKDMSIGHKRSLSSVMNLIGQMGFNVSEIKRKMKDLIIKTFISGLPLVKHQYRYCQPEEYAGNMCFHILGFDIMLSNDMRPILLQVNHTPSFTTDTPLDSFIKHNLIKDTLLLLNINTKTKEELYSKTKEYTSVRLLTGKRKILKGVDKDAEVEKAQRERDEYEALHMGGFEKIHPTDDAQLMQKYNDLLQCSQTIYAEENTLRGRLIKEERMKINRLAKETDKPNMQLDKSDTKTRQSIKEIDTVPKTPSTTVDVHNKSKQSSDHVKTRRPSTGVPNARLSESNKLSWLRNDRGSQLKQRIGNKCENMYFKKLNDVSRIRCSQIVSVEYGRDILNIRQKPSQLQYRKTASNITQSMHNSKSVKRASSMRLKIDNNDSITTRKSGMFLKPKVYDINEQNPLIQEERGIHYSGRYFPPKGKIRLAYGQFP